MTKIFTQVKFIFIFLSNIKNLKMNIKLTVSALFLSAAALAQDFTMEWGPKVKTKNSIGTIHVVNENSF